MRRRPDAFTEAARQFDEAFNKGKKVGADTPLGDDPPMIPCSYMDFSPWSGVLGFAYKQGFRCGREIRRADLANCCGELKATS